MNLVVLIGTTPPLGLSTGTLTVSLDELADWKPDEKKPWRVTLFANSPPNIEQQNALLDFKNRLASTKINSRFSYFQKSSAVPPLDILINSIEAHPIRVGCDSQTVIQFLKKDLPPQTSSTKKTKFHRAQITYNILSELQQFNSPENIERLIFFQLKESHSLSEVRLNISESPATDNQNKITEFHCHREKLSDLPNGIHGEMIFIRDNKKKFNPSQIRYLKEVCVTVGIAVRNSIEFQFAEDLKSEWESTFNAIKDAICLTDENYQIMHFNESFANYSTDKYDSMYGKNLFEILFDENPFSRELLQQDQYTLTKAVQKNSDEILLEVKSQILRHASKKPRRLQIVRDLTQQKKLERQIFESTKMAELGTISSSIAHELNNPLAGIISYLQLIEMDIPQNHPAYEDIMEMKKSANKCKDIVQNLLGFSRKNEDENFEKTDLKEVIEQAISLVRLQKTGPQPQIENLLEGNKFLIEGQPGLLVQALRNVIQNAVDSVLERLMSQPEHEAYIRIEADRTPSQIKLTITDNGHGIPLKDQSKIFNPLFTTHSSSQKPGLGLTIAFNILEQNNGTIEIYSQPLIGTSAKISFKSPDL